METVKTSAIEAGREDQSWEDWRRGGRITIGGNPKKRARGCVKSSGKTLFKVKEEREGLLRGGEHSRQFSSQLKKKRRGEKRRESKCT